MLPGVNLVGQAVEPWQDAGGKIGGELGIVLVDAAHQDAYLAVLRVDVGRNLRRELHQPVLEVDEAFELLTDQLYRSGHSPGDLPVRCRVAVDVVHEGGVERLLAFEHRRHHSLHASAQPGTPAGAGGGTLRQGVG